MKRIFGKRGCLILVCLVLLGGAIAYLTLGRSEPPDTRFNGAYRLDDGRLVLITPSIGEVLRYRMMSGRSSTLHAFGDLSYESGPGWRDTEPIELRVEFEPPPQGRPSTGLTWHEVDAEAQHGSRIDFEEILSPIPTGELTLWSKLVLPHGDGPFPVVVLVHGSGKQSAVDTYSMPYLFAPHGVATLAYDKRGTGRSTGKFSQNFHLLSDDTVAAVEWLRTRPEIDPNSIHLAGYSQGGWIAPLAASKTEGIRSLLINYGPMVPITEEDRWGYRYALYEQGFGEDAVAKVDRINDVIGAIADHGEDRWDELEAMLDEAEGEDWYEAVKGSDSLIGYLSGGGMPLWVAKLLSWWMSRGDEPFVDRLYDPVPTVTELDVPSLWIFGSEDSSMPSQDSIDKLEQIRALGRPIEIEVFPEAEHGILLFTGESSSDRKYHGYAPGYLDLQVEWLRRQSGLTPPESVDLAVTVPADEEVDAVIVDHELDR
jgi:pimeloyl-ACP methyl ester carboxylesterase